MARYRLLEMLPGSLVWATFALMLLLSWQLPLFVAVFIIFYDIFWLLRTVYLFILLHVTFRKMRHYMRVDWSAKLQGLNESNTPAAYGRTWDSLYHLVIFPMYREPYSLVRESLLSLRRVHHPKDKMIVLLATEEAGGEESLATAALIREEFQNDFFKFVVTRHPRGLAGEIPGKGSNETWAAKQVKQEIIDPMGIPYDRILVSVFDVDSQIFPDYFSVLAYTFLTAKRPDRSSYQPIPLFNNNIYDAPALTRIVALSTTFWNMMQQCRPENLVTFSSHSMPWQALTEIGFWDTNVVSEDSRIFWQCYVHYRGDWRTEPLFYPVSMDANVAPTFWQTMRNMYRQQRRHAWGSENIAYIISNFRKYPEIPRKFYWSFTTIEAFHSWATSSIMIFLLGWLPIWLGGDFHTTVLSHNLPRITSYIMLVSNIAIPSLAILGIMLLPPKPVWFRARHYLLYLLEWALMPITLIFYSSLPAIDAETRLMLGGKWRLGFWVTPKIRRNPEEGRGSGKREFPRGGSTETDGFQGAERPFGVTPKSRHTSVVGKSAQTEPALPHLGKTSKTV